jgi:hypothetical protein
MYSACPDRGRFDVAHDGWCDASAASAAPSSRFDRDAAGDATTRDAAAGTAAHRDDDHTAAANDQHAGARWWHESGFDRYEGTAGARHVLDG